MSLTLKVQFRVYSGEAAINARILIGLRFREALYCGRVGRFYGASVKKSLLDETMEFRAAFSLNGSSKVCKRNAMQYRISLCLSEGSCLLTYFKG